MLRQWKWRAVDNSWGMWYACHDTKKGNGAKRRTIYMHRAIMGAQRGNDIDHINRNGLDNRRVNLRVCTCAQNQCNRGPQVNNKSGYKGVSWKKDKSKWNALIYVGGKKIHLGYYDDLDDAAIAYNRAAIEKHGEFAWLNPVPK